MKGRRPRFPATLPDAERRGSRRRRCREGWHQLGWLRGRVKSSGEAELFVLLDDSGCELGEAG
eukprot:4032178-Amphidinium_carterae.1